MRLSIFLAVVLCCLAVSVIAGPVPKKTEAVKATGRQAPAAPAAPAPADEDDEEEDDDDDVDLDIGDDDDDDDDDEDDEDDEEDDEDDDYLERIIEDILGDDDDDDDEDETPAAAPPAPVAVPQAAPAPAVPAAVVADLNAEQLANAVNPEDTNAEADASGDEDEYSESGDVQPEGQAVNNVQEVEPAESVQTPVIQLSNVLPAQTVVSQAAPAASDDEDEDEDEDDDDDVDLDITDDDDDDDDEDDEEDDEDDEDDEEDDITDITGARRARNMDTDISEPNSHVPAVYVAKYNRFVDTILNRINKILRTNYDPVTVKLSSSGSGTKSNKTKSKKGKGKTKRKSTKKSGTKKSSGSSRNEAGKNELKTVTEKIMAETTEKLAQSSQTDSIATTTPQPARSSENRSEERRKQSTTSKKTKTKSSKNGNKKKSKAKSKPKARATLYGLASLQRSGDVTVNMMSDHTTIKTKFSLGPLVLKVEKEFGRTAKKELRSATATTAEMSGRLSLRVLHGGAATLHSIRVLQPKQVRVESADDHDRTREFVWRRSSHIAHLVSQKLSSATKSMLRPPPVPALAA